MLPSPFIISQGLTSAGKAPVTRELACPSETKIHCLVHNNHCTDVPSISQEEKGQISSNITDVSLWEGYDHVVQQDCYLKVCHRIGSFCHSTKTLLNIYEVHLYSLRHMYEALLFYSRPFFHLTCMFRKRQPTEHMPTSKHTGPTNLSHKSVLPVHCKDTIAVTVTMLWLC